MITGSITPLNIDDLSGPISIETSKKYFSKKIGNCYSFFGNNRGDPLFIIGPDWIRFLLILIIVSIVYYISCKIKWNNLGGLMKFMGIMIYLLYFISHIYTEIINPGYPKHNLDSKTGEPRVNMIFAQFVKYG